MHGCRFCFFYVFVFSNNMISKDTGHALNAFMLPSFLSIVRQCRYPPNKASMIIIERQISMYLSKAFADKVEYWYFSTVN